MITREFKVYLTCAEPVSNHDIRALIANGLQYKGLREFALSVKSLGAGSGNASGVPMSNLTSPDTIIINEKGGEKETMAKADFSGNFVNAENTKDNDVLEIIGEGFYPVDQETHIPSTIMNVPVRCADGKNRTYSPWKQTGNKFIAAWTDDTMKWIGHKFTAKLVEYMSYGVNKKRVDGEPLL